MNKPIYDYSHAVIGHVLEAGTVTFIQDRGGKTSFFYNKVADKTFDMSGRFLAKGNRALDLLRDTVVVEATDC